MAEEKKKSYRLFKVAQELGVGVSSLVDYLNGNGHKVSNTPNEKLSEEQYELLLRQFASDAVQKQRAEQLRQISREAQQAHHKQVAEAEVVAPPVAEPAVTATPEPAPQPVAEVVARPQLKVVGKIDLNARKSAPPVSRENQTPVVPVAPVVPEPVAEEVAAPAPVPEPEPAPEPMRLPEPEVVPEPVAEVSADVQPPLVEDATPEVAAPESVIRASDNTPKLEGLKVVGKVNLNTLAPSGRTRPGTAEEEATRRKRKRKSTVLPPSTQPSNRTGQQRTGGPGDRRTDGVVSSNNLGSGNPQDNLRNTLAGMHRGPNRSRQKIRRDKRDVKAARREAEEQLRQADMNVLEVTEFLTANELANLMDVSVNQIIAKCLELGLFVSINQRIDADVIQLLAEEFGYEVRFLSPDETFAEPEDDEDDPEELEPRAPIVTVMGHVDHGKTSLLDHIRKANVIAGEAGGITQHIGAYAVQLPDGRHITFLDTPGHEAFTAMRARGAQLTDVAIIVVAADDQVMPQTREAINHAQAAGVPMVFAINKIDKEGAQPEKIKEQLAQMNLLVEDWGGKIGCELISAKSGQGIEDLLERVLLEAEALELKANPNRLARGTVVEAQLDKGRGVVSTVLVQNGTLNVGDVVVANNHWGRIKAMTDERGHRVKEATPGMPVQILGLDGVPQAGDKFVVMEDERAARELATKRQQLIREQTLRSQKRVTLEEVARRAAQGDFQELNIIVKGDVDGSVEALADSLLKLSTPEVVVVVVHKAVGQITESDVLLASASDALVIGFQVRPSPTARRLAQTEKIDIRLYSVIYDAIDEIRDAMEGLLKPTVEEEVQAAAEVREVFRISKVGAVAGCMVIDGKVNRGHPARLIRDGVVVHTGKILALKRFKDDVKEVAQGFECGISLENFNDIKPGDIIETFTEVEVKRTLAQTVTS